MDNFNVPKKVNRHVLKALNLLSEGDTEQAITISRICDQVKYQMRNLVPVPNVEHCIQKSLKNLSEIGLIERQGHTRYCIGRRYATPPACSPNQGPPDKRIFRVADYRNRSKSNLDPNLKRTYTEDSLSGDEFDKTRKRMRSNNKQLRYVGRNTILPRARQHNQSLNLYHPETSLGINSQFKNKIDSSNKCTGEALNENNQSENSEVFFSNVTPTTSLKIIEITDEDKKTNDICDIAEPSGETRDDIQMSKSEGKELNNANSESAVRDNSFSILTTINSCCVKNHETGPVPVEENTLTTLSYFN